jgi:hypothetical protein
LETPAVITHLHADAKRFGETIPPDQRDLVNRLRGQAFALQVNFNRAEDCAHVLAELIQSGEGSVEMAVDNTYEGVTVHLLREQLFRLMIVDLHAAILDASKGSGSLTALVAALQKPKAVPAIKAYYADPAAFTAEVEGLDDPAERAARIEEAVVNACEGNRRVVAGEWAAVKQEKDILDSVDAERIRWARHHAIAHFKRTNYGLISLGDVPPHGNGPLQIDEPVRFIEHVRPFAYLVFSLVTANHWVQGGIGEMYAKAFWDRFKNGHTDVAPGPFEPFDPRPDDSNGDKP